MITAMVFTPHAREFTTINKLQVYKKVMHKESIPKGPLTTEKLRRYPEKTWYGPHNFLAAYTNNNG